LKVCARPAATGSFAPSVLVLPKMPSSDAPLCIRVAALRQPGGFREHLRHHHARLDALHQERSEVAVQRADPVVHPQPEAGADDNGF
jgi:hypothetical protein